MKIKHWPIGLTVIVFLGLILVFTLFNQEIAYWAYPNDKSRNGKTLKDFLGVLGGLAVIAGLYISFIRSRAMENNVENQNAQLSLTRDANLNEQFKNAVEHLGSERKSIILGGIAELHQLADNQRDKFAKVVADIYTSFCRSEANIKKGEENISQDLVIAIVKNLTDYAEVYEGCPIELNNTNLSFLKLENCVLKNWNFSESIIPKKISRVILKNCQFGKSKFYGSLIEKSSFDSCLFANAYIELSDFNEIKFITVSSFTVTAIKSSFNKVIFPYQIFSSNFISCKINSSEFENLLRIHFYCSLIKNTIVKSRVDKSSFEASALINHHFYSDVKESIFTGVCSNELLINRNLIHVLKNRINMISELNGVSSKKPMEIKYPEKLSAYDAHMILDQYNYLVDKYGSGDIHQEKAPPDWPKL